MRIADDVKAIKAHLDRINGTTPSGRFFSEKGEARETRFSDIYPSMGRAMVLARESIQRQMRDAAFSLCASHPRQWSEVFSASTPAVFEDRCMYYVGRPTTLCARKTCATCDPWRTVTK